METNEKVLLPALEYCSLARASSLIGCEEADLLHWAEIGAIELCLKFNNYEAAFYTKDTILFNKDEVDEWINKKYADGVFDALSTTYFSQPYLSGMKIPFNLSYSKEYGPRREFLFDGDITSIAKPICYISGLWSIHSMFDDDIFGKLQIFNKYDVTRVNVLFKQADARGDDKEYLFSAPTSARAYKNNLLVEPQEIVFSFRKEDLYITKLQISKIKDIQWRNIPNLISGDTINPVEDLKKPRVTKKQSDYIIALLKSHGITDEDLKGSVMELKNKINRKASSEIPEVDDKTLIDWIMKAGVNR